MQQLEENLLDYFPNLDDPDEEWQWLKNPFSCDPKHKPTLMSNFIFESLIEISEFLDAGLS